MAQTLDQVLSVAGLAPGASVTLPHSLMNADGSRLRPNFIRPDRSTPIGVDSATTNSITFTNRGSVAESSFFHATKDHSIQQAGSVDLFWQGGLASAGVASDLIEASPRWTDLMVPDTQFRAGTAAPTLTVFLGGTRVLAFSSGDEVLFEVQMPHSWALGTALSPHIHLSFPNATAGQYVFGLEYTIAKIGDVFPPTVSIETAITAAPGVANKHAVLALPSIDMAAFAGLSTMIVARLYRKTGVASAYPQTIFLLEFDYHYQMDTLGSTQEFVK